jgi:hypothetical protein
MAFTIQSVPFLLVFDFCDTPPSARAPALPLFSSSRAENSGASRTGLLAYPSWHVANGIARHAFYFQFWSRDKEEKTMVMADDQNDGMLGKMWSL